MAPRIADAEAQDPPEPEPEPPRVEPARDDLGIVAIGQAGATPFGAVAETGGSAKLKELRERVRQQQALAEQRRAQLAERAPPKRRMRVDWKSISLFGVSAVFLVALSTLTYREYTNWQAGQVTYTIETDPPVAPPPLPASGVPEVPDPDVPPPDAPATPVKTPIAAVAAPALDQMNDALGGQAEDVRVIGTGDPSDMGVMTISVDSEAVVWVGDEKLGDAPVAPFRIAAGTYTLKAVRKKDGAARTMRVRVDAGMPKTAQINFE